MDRRGLPLSITFQNPWNVHDYVPLHEIPLFLQQAFIAAEDGILDVNRSYFARSGGRRRRT